MTKKECLIAFASIMLSVALLFGYALYLAEEGVVPPSYPAFEESPLPAGCTWVTIDGYKRRPVCGYQGDWHVHN